MFVREMFDRILTQDCPPHRAVLKWDNHGLANLFKEGYNVNAVDKGGRNVMHIIATNAWDEICAELDTWFLLDCVSGYEVSLDTTDCVFQWTPLQYAIKSGDWFTVTWLLERNVDRSGLDMIRQRADYIHRITIDAAVRDSVLLLEFFMQHRREH
jgi:hypothetical protein